MSPARWGHPDGCPPAWAARNVISSKSPKRLERSSQEMWADPAPFDRSPREDSGKSDRLAPPHPELSGGGEAVAQLSSENRKPEWRSV